MRIIALFMALLAVARSAAADDELRLTDADTVVWQGTKYRLDGIDAPESAQKCLGQDGSPWRCGEAAAKALATFIAGKTFACTDVGEDRKYHRRLGQCFANGLSIEHWLVQQGWAIEFKKHSNGRFAADERDAMQNRRGIWASCFTDPRDFRYSNKSFAELKGHCPTAPAAIAQARDELFWKGSYIKAKVFDWGRQLATGLIGIYHAEGCVSYRTNVEESSPTSAGASVGGAVGGGAGLGRLAIPGSFPWLPSGGSPRSPSAWSSDLQRVLVGAAWRTNMLSR